MLQLKMKHLHNFFFTYSKGSWLVVSGDSEMCEHLAPISITLYNRKIPYACKVAANLTNSRIVVPSSNSHRVCCVRLITNALGKEMKMSHLNPVMD